MINRILIRLKVVQTLYSFMLTRSDFHIAASPENTSRDSRAAYDTYLDTLLLVLKLSGQRLSPSDTIAQVDPVGDAKRRLGSAPLISSLLNSTDLTTIAQAEGRTLYIYKDMLQLLHDRVTASTVFADYAKKRTRDISLDSTFWITIIDTVISRSREFEDAARTSPDFTIKGFNRGIEMAIDTLRNYTDAKSLVAGAQRQLQTSLDQSELLYHALLTLPAAITRIRAEQIESAKEKYLPTGDDLNPNMRFVDNRYVEAVNNSEELAGYFKTNPFTWEPDYFLLKKLLDRIMQSKIYSDYMNAPESSLHLDCEFWREVMKDIVIPSDELAEMLEGRSIYWNDDISVIGTFVLKTIRRCESDDDGCIELMPAFNDEDDEVFGRDLLAYTIDNADDYHAIIDRFIDPSRWDVDRLALIDIVILLTAIAEILNFPSIPVAVSINEYVEIANFYGNKGSGSFVNGILYSVVNYLTEEQRLAKPFTAKQ